MPPVHIRVSGAWKDSTGYIRVGGVWKVMDQAGVRTGGAWKESIVSGPTVIIAATKSILDFAIAPTNSYAYVGVDSDGTLKSSTSGTAPNSTYETWLDAGSNSDVWVQRTIISGSLSTDAGSSRLACTSDRIFGVQITGIGVQDCVIDLKFYDAASGGTLLDTQRVTLSAEVESLD